MYDKQNRPDFIIVGCMKAGTSSVRNFLSQHDDIIMLDHEGNFFNVEENYQRGVDWYREQFLKKSPKGHELWGEKTVDYSYLPSIPQRIFKTNSRVKLIWIFRNPVYRSYSNYLHELRRGREWLSFERAIKREKKRILKNPYYGYIKRSIYHEQLTRFLSLFSLENMHFILLEDLINNHDKVLSDLLNFLGLKNYNKFVYAPANPAKPPRFPKLLWASIKCFKEKSILWRLVHKINFQDPEKNYKKINKKIEEELKEKFKAHNKRLEKLINRDLSVWD